MIVFTGGGFGQIIALDLELKAFEGFGRGAVGDALDRYDDGVALHAGIGQLEAATIGDSDETIGRDVKRLRGEAFDLHLAL